MREYMTTTGEILRKIRTSKGLQRWRVAGAANISTSYLTRIEEGNRTPSREVAHDIIMIVCPEKYDQMMLIFGFAPENIIKETQEQLVNFTRADVAKSKYVLTFENAGHKPDKYEFDSIEEAIERIRSEKVKMAARIYLQYSNSQLRAYYRDGENWYRKDGRI